MLTTLKDKCAAGAAAVIVVDMQNDFCHSEGAGAINGSNVSHAQAIVPALRTLIEEARSASVPVFFIRTHHNQWTNSAVWMERRQNRKAPNCVPDTWGADWYELYPEPGDPIITKHRFSAFIGTDLDLILRAQGIQTIIMTGTATNVCVESTARDGFMMDYYVVFLDDCTSTGDPEMHQATLKNMGRSFGVVCNSSDVIATWAPVPAAALA